MTPLRGGILFVLAALQLPAAAGAAELKTLHAFASPDGLPLGLTRDAAGNFYGEIIRGGPEDPRCFAMPQATQKGCGGVFKLSPDGQLTLLYSFSKNEAIRLGIVVANKQGDLYGTAVQGGDYRCYPTGCGSLYKLTAAGRLTNVHYFDFAADGGNPAELLLGESGDLYGIAVGGGDGRCQGFPFKGCGGFFHLAPDGKFMALHLFAVTEGAGSAAHLALSPKGDLYGTVSGGNCCGMIFRVTETGSLVVLHVFTREENTGHAAGIVADAAGVIYVSTSTADDRHDCSDDCGSLVRLAPDGQLRLLHKFSGKDGKVPAPVGIDSKGNVYGLAVRGGNYDRGTIFEATPQGKFAVLHEFSPTEGGKPSGPVVFDKTGRIYGTTQAGGPDDGGTIYEFTP